MSDKPQSFDSHAKMVPPYHYVGSLLLLVVLIWSLLGVVRSPSVDSAMMFVLVIVVTFAFFYGRLFALGVQDRVIRLEERLRMERLLPDDLKPRIGEISTEALIGLRFASDGELEGLVRRVLDGELVTRKDVKAQVKEWRADHQRV